MLQKNALEILTGLLHSSSHLGGYYMKSIWGKEIWNEYMKNVKEKMKKEINMCEGKME